MEEKKREVSFLVFVGFLLMFVVFLFINPEQKSSGNVIIGSTTLGGSPSVITLIVLFIVLVVILAAVFILLKKIKKKKIKIENPEVKKEEISSVNDNRKEIKLELDNGDIEKLFSGDGGENNRVKEEIKKEPQYNDSERIESVENKVLANLQDLKNKIRVMLNQGLNKDQMVSNLKSQGITMDQIGKSIDEVNLDNLRSYINQALKQGFTKDQIIRNLVMHGWKQEQIAKVI